MRSRLTLVLAALLVLGLVAAALLVARAERRLSEGLERIEQLQERVSGGGSPLDQPESPSAGDESDGRDLLELISDLLGEKRAGLFEDLFGGSLPGAECLSVLTEGLSPTDVLNPFAGPQAGATEEQGLESVAREVERLRRLRFERLPTPTYLSESQLARRVAASFDDFVGKRLALESRALVALGALPPGTNLKQLQADAASEAVAGFFDPKTKELVVRSDAEAGLSAMERLILAHELEHALVDQVFGIPQPALEPRAGQEDASLAALAVVEGDATFTMQLYTLRNLSVTDQFSLLTGALPLQGQGEDLPHHVERSLMFPYIQGMSFVCELYRDGGWTSVNQAYSDPPASSAQVLFPERYELREEPIDPRDPAGPGAPWKLAGVRSLGAAELLWLFEAPGGDPSRALDGALDRASEWAGGELHVFRRGPDTAVGVALIDRDGGRKLCSSVRAWYEAAFPRRELDPRAGETLVLAGPRQDAVLRCSGNQVHLGIAPDLSAARSLSRPE